MALEAPLPSSSGSRLSAFSQHNMSVPSESNGLGSPFPSLSSPKSFDGSLPGGIADQSHLISPSFHHHNNLMSPNDIVGPSPVHSNGTETTEIEEEASEDVKHDDHRLSQPQLISLNTTLPDEVRKGGEESRSVIHAPENFKGWKSPEEPPNKTTTPDRVEKTDSSSSPRQTATHASPPPVAEISGTETPIPPPSRPSISTNVSPAPKPDSVVTPRAQDLSRIIDDAGRLRSSSSLSLEKIEEVRESEAEDDHRDGYDSHGTIVSFQLSAEVVALQSALQECWTLCNTLANLSSIHRRRVFHSSGTPDAHEKAWKTCWKLCQQLYDYRDEESDYFNVRSHLELCRDFCQALFDIRHKRDEVADSILRVSFELNNHLYSAQDSRNLPEIFRERTLDFYITLCHRLMKQWSDMIEETDALLRACWNLAEMLFQLRQNRRDGRAPDEELLGSAVQACWDLCDIFREGWTQVRPDRSTPRPSTANFDLSDHESRASTHSSIRSSRTSLLSTASSGRRRKPPHVPETPITILDDTPISPESVSPQLPNILVLGPQPNQQTWSSNASDLSNYTRTSRRTSSTAQTPINEDPNLTRIKVLILRAAMDRGFVRENAEGRSGFATLQAFVNKLPTGSFGSQPTNSTLLTKYKNLVISDQTFARQAPLPPPGKAVSAAEMAKSVLWISRHNPRLAFLRELFELVFCFSMDDVQMQETVGISV